MKYQKYIPIKPLQEYVRYFGVCEYDYEDNLPKAFNVIVDGYPGLIYREMTNPYFNIDGRQHILPQLYLHGVSSKPSLHSTTGSFKNIVVNLQPTALKALFNVEARDLSGQYIDFDLLDNSLSERLVNSKSNEAKIKILSDYLLQKVNNNPSHQMNTLTHAISIIKNQGRAITLKELQSTLNITERSLERLFQSYIGISPVLYARIARFQSSLNLLRSGQFNLHTDIAYQNGYADQSHYIREFKAFTGVSPHVYFRFAQENIENYPEWHT